MSNEFILPTIESRIEEIKQLHSDILGSVRTTLQKAQRIGELLSMCRSEIPHGQWMSWLKEHLDFSDRTARNYITIYVRGCDLSDSTKSLTEIYESFIEHKPKPEWTISDPRSETLEPVSEPLPKLDEPVTPVAPVTKTEVIAPTPKLETVSNLKEDSTKLVEKETLDFIKELFLKLSPDGKNEFLDWVIDLK